MTGNQTIIDSMKRNAKDNGYFYVLINSFSVILSMVWLKILPDMGMGLVPVVSPVG